jgi:prepilin-type N-terminal cleavage/methylation domain-containing protein
MKGECGVAGPASLAPPVRTGRRLPARAFTLIELMVVIGLVAIIIAAGVPPFARALRKEGIRKAVSDVVEGCSHARAQAILQGVTTELVIRAQDGQITVRHLGQRAHESSAQPSFTGEEPPKRARVNFTANLPDDIAVKFLDVNFQDQMDKPEAGVRFFSNGTSDEFTIVLSSIETEYQISLDVITALTKVKVLR